MDIKVPYEVYAHIFYDLFIIVWLQQGIDLGDSDL